MLPDFPQLSDSDWEILRNLRDVLVPLEILTKRCCGRNFTILQVTVNVIEFYIAFILICIFIRNKGTIQWSVFLSIQYFFI